MLWFKKRICKFSFKKNHFKVPVILNMKTCQSELLKTYYIGCTVFNFKHWKKCQIAKQVLNHSTIISILESRIMQPGIFLNFKQLILKWFFFAGIMKTALALMMSATWPMTTVSGATTLILMLDSVIQVHNLFLFCNYFLFHFLRS